MSAPFDHSLQSYPKAAAAGNIFCNIGGDDGERVIPFDTTFISNAKAATNGLGYVTGSGGAVTQLTNASTGVELNKLCGQITTVALTTAAAAEEIFTVTNSFVDANDVVVVSTTYAGAGTCIVAVNKVTAGAFDIVIANLHASSALNAVVVINFMVLKSVAA